MFLLSHMCLHASYTRHDPAHMVVSISVTHGCHSRSGVYLFVLCTPCLNLMLQQGDEPSTQGGVRIPIHTYDDVRASVTQYAEDHSMHNAVGLNDAPMIQHTSHRWIHKHDTPSARGHGSSGTSHSQGILCSDASACSATRNQPRVQGGREALHLPASHKKIIEAPYRFQSLHRSLACPYGDRTCREITYLEAATHAAQCKLWGCAMPRGAHAPPTAFPHTCLYWPADPPYNCVGA